MGVAAASQCGKMKFFSRMAELDQMDRRFGQLEPLESALRDIADYMGIPDSNVIGSCPYQLGPNSRPCETWMDYTITAGYSTVDLIIQSQFILLQQYINISDHVVFKVLILERPLCYLKLVGSKQLIL